MTLESFTYIHQSTFVGIVGTSTSFHHWCKEKISNSISDEQHQSTSWMKLDESLPSILKYFFLCSRCTVRYISVHMCMNDYLRCAKCEVHDCVHKHVIRCMKKHVPRFLIFEALFTKFVNTY